MKKLLTSQTATTGLAIFSMLFGAGNLMYPILAGKFAGQHTFMGILGFCLTAVFLPVIGLISMILFDGNYENFFNRLNFSASWLGQIPGRLIIWVCMMILGPLLVIPRITTLSHTMTAPFIPFEFFKNINPLSSFVFSIIFLAITFLATYRENKIVEILGNFISPALLASLSIIIVKGIYTGQTGTITTQSASQVFTKNLVLGYETLDLLGALFFASIVLNILKNTLGHQIGQKPRLLAWIGLKAGILGTSFLGLVYIGMAFLGKYHSQGLENINAGELFREISFRILGTQGSIIIATAVLMACLSTAIALSAVVAEYAQYKLFRGQINFASALVLVLAACIPLSTVGLSHVLQLTGGPITYVGYPVLITITVCNIAYKLFDFKPIKIPVLAIFVITLLSYIS